MAPKLPSITRRSILAAPFIADSAGFMRNPNVSILMPVFNGELYIRRCLESVIRQTYRNWELIVVDDCSTDKTVDVVQNYLDTDSRIRLIRKRKNRGLAIQLNESIDLARGELLARMDVDDEMLPKRLESQVNFLRKHPEIGVLGSKAILVDKYGKPVGNANIPELHDDIRKLLPYRNPIVHSATMMRREIFRHERYSETLRRCIDYELWSRLIDQTKFYNLQEPLIRLHVDYRGKTWQAIKYDLLVHFLIIFRRRAIGALTHPLVSLIRNLAVKFGVYSPATVNQ